LKTATIPFDEAYQTAQRKAFMSFNAKRMLLLVVVMVALSMRSAAGQPHDDDRAHGIWHDPHSGITGQVFKVAFVTQPLPGPGPIGIGPPAIEIFPYEATLFIWSDEGRFVTSVATDEDGNFQAFLKPGKYVIVPYVSPEDAPLLSALPVTVTVKKKQFTPATVFYAEN
jgi:hypothetical protein